MSSASVQCTSTAASPSARRPSSMRSARATWPAEHGFAELEDVVARHVQHRGFDLLEAQLAAPGAAAPASAVPGARRAGCLRRGRQRRPACAGRPRPPCTRWPWRARRCASQAGSAVRSTGLDAHGQTPAPSSAVNQAALVCWPVQPRQLHQRQHVVGQVLAVALQRLGAVLAGLARGDADLDQLALGEQAHRLRRAEHAAPVEVRAADGEDLALAVAGRARGGADGVAGLLRQQRLVAVHRVQRLAGRAPAARRAGRGGSACVQHRRMAARRRSTCATTSDCISRNSSASSCSLASAAVSL